MKAGQIVNLCNYCAQFTYFFPSSSAEETQDSSINRVSFSAWPLGGIVVLCTMCDVLQLRKRRGYKAFVLFSWPVVWCFVSSISSSPVFFFFPQSLAWSAWADASSAPCEVSLINNTHYICIDFIYVLLICVINIPLLSVSAVSQIV